MTFKGEPSMDAGTHLRYPSFRVLHAGRQRGAIAIMTAVMMVMFIGFAALAVDIAWRNLVKNELQNAADAAALAGAACLYRSTQCGNTTATEPDWGTARAKALAYISQNKAAGASLSTGTVQTGYWNLARTPSTLQSETLTPLAANDAPAVQVMVPKTTGVNGGPIATFFARIFGIQNLSLSANAIAVVSPPSSVTPGNAMPFVLSKCLFDTYWDSASNSPRTATTTNPITVTEDSGNNPQSVSVPQVIGQPYTFPAVSSYSIAGTNCNTGQWTSFNLGTESTNAINGLISTGNATEIAVGQDTYVSSGAVAALYQSIRDCSAAGDRSCEYKQAPVIADTNLTHMNSPILGFACVRILDANWGGSIKYILMQMSADESKCLTGGSGGGINYGSIVPPRLAL